MKVEVTNRHKTKKVPLKRVSSVVSKGSRKLLPSKSYISVAFLGDKEMTEINEEYTGRQGSTDVLSFGLGEDFKKNSIFEILISLDRAARQAREKEVTLTDEVVRLLVHSVVHLAGFDHYSVKHFKAMRSKELELLLNCI